MMEHTLNIRSIEEPKCSAPERQPKQITKREVKNKYKKVIEVGNTISKKSTTFTNMTLKRIEQNYKYYYHEIVSLFCKKLCKFQLNPIADLRWHK